MVAVNLWTVKCEIGSRVKVLALRSQHLTPNSRMVLLSTLTKQLVNVDSLSPKKLVWVKVFGPKLTNIQIMFATAVWPQHVPELHHMRYSTTRNLISQPSVSLVPAATFASQRRNTLSSKNILSMVSSVNLLTGTRPIRSGFLPVTNLWSLKM